MQRRPFLGSAAAAAATSFAAAGGDRPATAAAQPAAPAATATRPPVALADWGSFHVGGREVVVSGQPVREVLFSPGGVPARVDPNGTYLMGAMYAQYMVPAERRGRRRRC